MGRRPIHPLPEISIGCEDANIVVVLDDDGRQVPRSPSSEEDNSPTEMNNCRRILDKPPLVKRFAMGMGFKRSTEDSRPLVHTKSPPDNSYTAQTMSEGYVNEAICDPDKFLLTRYNVSNRQTFMDFKSSECHPAQIELTYPKPFLRKPYNDNSSTKTISPCTSLTLDGLSVAERNELRGVPWFQAGIPREISLEVLSKQNPGAFLVRQSNTKIGCFALSLRVPPPSPRVAHYLILRTTRGYKIKGFSKEFLSLKALITHHSVMPELLPIPLTLPKTLANGSNGDIRECRRNSSDSDNFDSYGSSNDFRKIMTDPHI